MTTHKEALTLALEALRDNQHLVADNERHAYVMEYNGIIEKCEKTLSQTEQEPVASIQHWCTYCQGHNAHNCQFNTQLPRVHTYTTNNTVALQGVKDDKTK